MAKKAGKRMRGSRTSHQGSFICCLSLPGLRIKETKEVYEGEVTELTPCETENPMGGYGKTISHVIIGLKTAKGTKQLKVSACSWAVSLPQGRPAWRDLSVRRADGVTCGAGLAHGGLSKEVALLLFFLFIYSFIYFWFCWVFVAARGFSLVAASRGYSSLRCAGFSLWWLLLLWSTGLGAQA